MAASNSNVVKQPATETGSKGFRAYSGWWWVLAVLLVGGFFALSQASDPEQEKLAARRQQIEAMTAAERERLERNFERFQSLSPERQEALLEIEKAVREDEDLNKTLLGYDRWLNTLSPWERAQLRNAKTKEEKLQLVSAITTARKQEAEAFVRNEQEWEQAVRDTLLRFQGQERRPEPVRVSDNQLSNMMTALDEYASRVKVSKNSLPGCAAYNLQLLAEALKANIQE